MVNYVEEGFFKKGKDVADLSKATKKNLMEDEK